MALSGADTVVMARTGSGKTCAFLIPLLERLLASNEQHAATGKKRVRAVILSPTRELSIQTLRVFSKLAADTGIRAVGIHGGEGMERQFDLLASGPDVVVATPGRLAHHVTEIPDFDLGGCQVCVLDEADRLLEMGFGMQIRQIARSMPSESASCQKLLFSATMPKVLVEFTKSGFATDPTVVRLDQEATVSADLRVAFLTCRSTDKDAALLHVLHQIRADREQHQSHSPLSPHSSSKGGSSSSNAMMSATRTGLTLIFAATRHHVEYVATLLRASGAAPGGGEGDGVAMVYGSMDQEARKVNLAAFRSGRKPVLVVTDVAARGIDVPMIDHVVHYHFPPSPKLFVHRSGRAARAGRIGFCWALVEPDELPYMVDLHLFLGRKLTAGAVDAEATPEGKDDDKSDKRRQQKEISYTLDEMTPNMVHYGSVPESVVNVEVENVQRVMNSELGGSLEAETLRALTKVCRNAMKQYRRTRVEPSREGVRRAKAILEGERLETGQRIGGGAIPPHPLLIGIERERQRDCAAGSLGDLDNALRREDFLREMSKFRPKETVFEAFATGHKGSKDGGIVSQVDKGRTTNTKNRKNDSSASLAAMKNMRRQMRIARDKGSALVVAGSSTAIGDDDDAGAAGGREEGESSTAGDPHPDGDSSKTNQNDAVDKLQEPTVVNTKRRMSKAERRRLKKNPGVSATAARFSTTTNGTDMNGAKSNKGKRGSDFRDPAFFIDNDFTSNSEEAQRSRQIEAAMQPSSAMSAKGSQGAALRIEEAMLDIVGDENDDLVKKHRLMRWDKAKRKYVQTTVGAELSGDSKSKRTRLESGQVVKGDKLKLGELYEKWQKKTNRSVGRNGVFDEDDGDAAGVIAARTSKKRHPKGKGGATGGGERGGVEAGNEVKTAAAIKKEREKKQNLKVKNMKRSDRRAMESKQREEKAHIRKKVERTSSMKHPPPTRRRPRR